jgi:hypothetical protein
MNFKSDSDVIQCLGRNKIETAPCQVNHTNYSSIFFLCDLTVFMKNITDKMHKITGL